MGSHAARTAAQRVALGMAGWGVPLQGIRACLAAERERWILWAPVGIGLGVSCYFALPAEPMAWTGAGAASLMALLAILLRRRDAALLICLALLTPMLGFAAAQARTSLIAAPILVREVGPVPVTGRVVSIDKLEKGGRVVLTDLSIPRIDTAATPDRIRLRLRNAAELPLPGERVRIMAVVAPPPPPAAPGAFDFGRAAFFAGIGGAGYAVGRVERVEDRPVGFWTAILAATERLRVTMAARIDATVGGAEGGVIGAFLTGQQTAIPDHVMDDFRASGLAHLLSISGIHVSLVAALVFLPVRALLALIEPVALNWPIKKVAAVAGIAGAFAYMLLVGSPVPTVRSVLMTGLAMLAILLDRNPLSMRLIAFAAALVILKEPDSLMGASFQMSFGAVIALISAYEVISRPWAGVKRNLGWFGRIWLHLAGIAVTSVIATLATMPFSLYHFQQIQYYGVIANMIAVPVTSIWVMPLGLISYLAFPLGLEEWTLIAMGWGVTVILETARIVAAFPGSTKLVPAMPPWGLWLIVSGGLWLMLWRGRWRYWGVPVAALGVLSLAFVVRPDILVDDEGKLMAVRDASGGLALSSKVSGRFTAGVWLRRDGLTEGDSWPREGKSADGMLACDRQGCLYRTGNHTVALAKNREALVEDCQVADVVISPAPAPKGCRAPVVIDRWHLLSGGTHAIYLSGPEPRIETVGAERGQRPWVPAR
jgi:competence protein ComEC